jgi:hypothetical protein
MVDVQESSAKGLSLRFTINLGLCVPEIEEVLWGTERGQNAAGCVLRRRVGEVLEPSGKSALDLWWDPKQAQTAEEVEKAVLRGILPFFSHIISFRELKEQMLLTPGWLSNQAPDRIYLAILEARLGNKLAAENLLTSLLREKSKAGWAPNVMKVAHALNLEVPGE